MVLAAFRPDDPLSRYRRSKDVVYVDLHLRNTRQLFDARDPSPFRDRDLDDDAVEYLVSATEEIPRREKVVFSVVFSEEPVPHLLDADAVVQAIRTHFAYEEARARRQLRGLFRVAEVGAVVAVLLLALCFTLANALEKMGDGAFIALVREGLAILGWVALWRPLETLLYDWWPHVTKMRTLRRIATSQIEVRYVAR